MACTTEHARYCFDVLDAQLNKRPLPRYDGDDAKQDFPLFVTWNTIRPNGSTRLRGCIGNFAAMPLAKKVEGIHRVVLRKPGNVMLVISEPEVFRAPGSDCYIIFGEAQMQDPASGAGFNQQAVAAAQAAQARQEAEAARKAKAAGASSSGNSEDKAGVDPKDVFAGVEEGGKKEQAAEGEADATGLDESDIDTVMKQGKCSREKAIKALKNHDGDLINAIMEASD